MNQAAVFSINQNLRRLRSSRRSQLKPLSIPIIRLVSVMWVGATAILALLHQVIPLRLKLWIKNKLLTPKIPQILRLESRSKRRSKGRQRKGFSKWLDSQSKQELKSTTPQRFLQTSHRAANRHGTTAKTAMAPEGPCLNLSQEGIKDLNQLVSSSSRTT